MVARLFHSNDCINALLILLVNTYALGVIRLLSWCLRTLYHVIARVL